jgi:hypothetical protein
LLTTCYTALFNIWRIFHFVLGGLEIKSPALLFPISLSLSLSLSLHFLFHFLALSLLLLLSFSLSLSLSLSQGHKNTNVQHLWFWKSWRLFFFVWVKTYTCNGIFPSKFPITVYVLPTKRNNLPDFHNLRYSTLRVKKSFHSHSSLGSHLATAK